MREITGTEIMKMDLSAWLYDEVVEDANRRWTDAGQPAKTKEEWERIAKPLAKRHDSKLCLRMAVIKKLPAMVLRSSGVIA